MNASNIKIKDVFLLKVASDVFSDNKNADTPN